MAAWNELLEKSITAWNRIFREEKRPRRVPESEILRLVNSLETLFSDLPLRLWDVCCGGGRHTVALASLGHTIYASDIASNGVALTRQWLADENLQAEVEVADMTICPWPETKFHGAVSWDALPHNTLDNIQKAINVIYSQLVPGGLFLGTFQSTKSHGYGEGQEIEPATFVGESGIGAGIPHHYFDESGIRELFEKWELISLAEQVIVYAERGDHWLEHNPFPHTKWGVLARKGE